MFSSLSNLASVLCTLCIYMYVYYYKLFTWNTLGADTRLVSAEERVAANIPAVTIGDNNDTKAIT